MSVQCDTVASQKFTCPVVTADVPALTVAVNVITEPDATVVTELPADVTPKVVVVVSGPPKPKAAIGTKANPNTTGKVETGCRLEATRRQMNAKVAWRARVIKVIRALAVCERTPETKERLQIGKRYISLTSRNAGEL
jgi:hypothetical protein